MKKRLMRSRTDTKIAGVCGGIADYLNIDPMIVRILWVISAFIGGPSIGIYILCAIIIPKEPIQSKNTMQNETMYSDYKTDEEFDDEFDEPEADHSYEDLEEEEKPEREFKLAYLGIGMIGLGAYLGFQALFPNFNYRFLWPIILIVGGLLLLNRKNEGDYE